MITMDNTVVANALPKIMSDLDMSRGAQEWVATGYILMFSCLMIAGGRLTDIYGCRVTFTAGMVVFTIASAICGLAGDDAVLIVGRIVQGGGAALALPATQVIITVGRTDKQRSIGTIVWVGAAGGATALGPAIGGFIVQQWHWGWIFLINIVPGIMVVLLGLVVLTHKGENRSSRVDLPGVLISATMLFALVYALEAGRKLGWTDPSVLSVFALAVIALACFVVVESWAPDPMMNLRFFRNRVFVGGLLSQMLWGIGFNGMIFYAATFLQRFLGFAPSKAGLVMLPSAIMVMAVTPLAFWLAGRLGPRLTIGGGMALMAAGMILFSRIQQGDGYLMLMPGVLITGLGSALCMPLVMYVLKAVPERQAGVASGIINVIREASGAFGIAIVGLLIHAIPPEHDASARELEVFRSGTASGLMLGAVLVLIGGLISGLTLPSRRGWMGPKHGKRAPVVLDEELEPELDLEPVPSLQPLTTPQSEPHPFPHHHHAPEPVLAAPTAEPGDELLVRSREQRHPRERIPELEAASTRATPYDGLPVVNQKPHYPLRPYVPPREADGEWPPPPPEGWYTPYRPDDLPSDAGRPRPRGDAW
ncbi:putative multidrug resistance protein MdtD [Actinomadura sp. RB68]|uniref:Putative multidrug resistance protein MdtD n=2 Tax=Actinomadura macrotermitis TaxID=2585200 RepID=A0A7K0BWJ2_9ACTN|nr:putative multidrug resistance protein MdtD [Actinomadura macrotermitis]